LTKIKRLNQIIEAQKILEEQGKNINLIFIGKGEEENTLKKLVNKLKLNHNVWFYGPCYDEIEIGELIYNADLCVSPGNVGLTAIHVLSYGTPVATHDDFYSQMPEFEVIEENITGFFFKKDSIKSIVKKIDDWLFCTQHDREEVRESCYKVIDSKFNPNYQLKIMKSVIYEA
jgi:glycosyltransferase involved in cell wall biosynthesis